MFSVRPFDFFEGFSFEQQLVVYDMCSVQAQRLLVFFVNEDSQVVAVPDTRHGDVQVPVRESAATRKINEDSVQCLPLCFVERHGVCEAHWKLRPRYHYL